MERGEMNMKIQVLMGFGMMLFILPAFSMGISFVDVDTWPPFSDFRWLLMALGVVFLIVGRVMYERELSDRE